MLHRFRTRMTFSNVVSVVALFVALGGTSYAAITITGKNVKNSSLTGADVKNSSLTTSDVKNRSLLAADFRSGQLPAGPKGDTGAKGDKGDTGDPGTAVAFARVQANATLVPEASKNVVSVVRQPGLSGVYCFDLAPGVAPKVAVASGVRDDGPPTAIIETKLNNGGSSTATCPAANRDAQITSAVSGTLTDHAFYIIFD